MSALPFENGKDPRERAKASLSNKPSSNPLGARKDEEYVIVCMTPSVNWTRVGDKTIPIPESVHAEFSLSYRSRNTPANIAKDAADLQAAAKRDTSAIARGIKKDKACKKAYKKAAKEIKKISNAEYDKILNGLLDNDKSVVPKIFN